MNSVMRLNVKKLEIKSNAARIWGYVIKLKLDINLSFKWYLENQNWNKIKGETGEICSYFCNTSKINDLRAWFSASKNMSYYRVDLQVVDKIVKAY